MTNLKRMESRKPHSWWWDSYISPKNSRWLSDNLDETEQAVKKMMKLIEEDADSFAKKAEMYYRKRPELISHVEEFYRRYRSLAERYDHLTGDLKKNIANDLQSQSSGFSEIAVDAPAPDLKLARRRSGQQAAGFDFFLGSGSSSDNINGDESSCLTDSEADFDSLSVYNGGDQALQARIVELETELHELKEKMKIQQEEISENVVLKYEIELRAAEEKKNLAEEELLMLKDEVKLYESQISDPDSLALVEEVKGLKSKLHDSRIEILSLKQELDEGINTVKSAEKSKQNQMMEQLEVAVRDSASWKTKFNAERREVGKLQERLSRLKASLSDRDHEIRELKIAVSDAEEKIFPEKAQIKSEISRLMEEQGILKAQLREWESQGRSMQEEIRQLKIEISGQEQSFNAVITEKDSQLEHLREQLDEFRLERHKFEEEISSRADELDRIKPRLNLLQVEYDEMTALLRSRIEVLEEELEKQRIAISEEKREAIRQLCFSLEHYRNGYDELRCAILSQKQQRRQAVAA